MRVLVVRLGAYGDMLIITPLLRYLKQQGHEVYLNTSKCGQEMMLHNPYVDKLLYYEANSVPDHELAAYWEKMRQDEGCDVLINMCESLERAISLHPMDPYYNQTKAERRERCDKNFYEYAFEHARIHAPKLIPNFYSDFQDDYDHAWLRPEVFFSEEECEAMAPFIQKHAGSPLIIWGMSGSSLNKAYPYTHYVIADLLRKFPKAKVVTVGSELDSVLEEGMPDKVIKMCGKWTMRESILACSQADLVIAGDTGLLHGAGCFDTHKIGLIGSNTKNNITKHFLNDHSLEADSSAVACAPCFRIIYGASLQCPIDEVTAIPLCMSQGIKPELLLETIVKVLSETSSS